MATEVWMRNPVLYIKECAEVLHPNICWDAGLLVKRGLDAQRWLELHYPAAIEYRILVVAEQGTMELRPGTSPAAPFAVYPTWTYGEDSWDDLIELIENPVGENQSACEDKRLDVTARPIFGQEHRVVITKIPNAGNTIGRTFFRNLGEIQERYPEVIIHLHGSYSFRYAFGMGYASADFDAHEHASHGMIMMGNGKKIQHEQAPRWPQWMKVVGMTPGDLSIPRNRCIFTIKSAVWAGKHYGEDIAFMVRRDGHVDPYALVHTPARVQAQTKAGVPGDKVTCDTCSLANSCKFVREGAVCSLPRMETAPLAKQMGSRDVDVVLDGLGRILAMEAERFETGFENEKYSEDGKLDREVTVAGSQLFKHGSTYAKLLSPTLAAAGATKVGVFINGGGGGTQTTIMTQGQVIAQVVQQLEQKGIPRADITEDMIVDYIKSNQNAIEAQVRE